MNNCRLCKNNKCMKVFVIKKKGPHTKLHSLQEQTIERTYIQGLAKQWHLDKNDLLKIPL
jgi:hypothetical protein